MNPRGASWRARGRVSVGRCSSARPHSQKMRQAFSVNSLRAPLAKNLARARCGAWFECDSMRGIRGPSKSGGGWLANIEATPYNLLRCPMRGPQVSRESGTAGEPRREPSSERRGGARDRRACPSTELRDTILSMIKNPERYRRRAEAMRWGALRRMSPEESIAIGEALLTSEILKHAWTKNRRRPKCLAVALGIWKKWRTTREMSVERPSGLPRIRKGAKRVSNRKAKASSLADKHI